MQGPGYQLQVMAFRAAGAPSYRTQKYGGAWSGEPAPHRAAGRGESPAAARLAAAAASEVGRAMRLLVGALLIPTGLATVQGPAGTALAVVGLLAILETLFDVWLPGWLAGAAFDGRAARRAVRSVSRAG